MNKKGFAISGMVYTILLLFMMLIVMMLFNLQNRKMILDEIKEEVVEAVEKDNEMEVLENRIKVLENSISATSLFIKTHPVGSIYVTVSADEASVSMMNSKYSGSTWEVYGSGRTLVGVGSNGESEYLKSDLTGGKSNVSLTVNNLPTHSHDISHTHTTPSTELTNGKTNKAGSHHHTFSYSWPVNDFGLINSGSIPKMTQEKYMATYATEGAGEHVHTVSGTIPSMTTNSISTSKSGSAGGGISFSTQDPYITVYMYKRIS